MGQLVGYARVSTLDQTPDLQLDALATAGCWKVWTDHASGKLDRRPQLDDLMEHLRPGDTLVVWRLDRLGRSLAHLVQLLVDLDAREVGFRSLTESIDTGTAGGRLIFHVMGAMAQFERDLISERTSAGLAAARARGRNGGRPSVVTPDKLATARRLYDARDMTVAQIAAVVGVGRSTLYRALVKDAPASRSTSSETAASAASARRAG